MLLLIRAHGTPGTAAAVSLGQSGVNRLLLEHAPEESATDYFFRQALQEVYFCISMPEVHTSCFRPSLRLSWAPACPRPPSC